MISQRFFRPAIQDPSSSTLSPSPLSKVMLRHSAGTPQTARHKSSALRVHVHDRDDRDRMTMDDRWHPAS